MYSQLTCSLCCHVIIYSLLNHLRLDESLHTNAAAMGEVYVFYATSTRMLGPSVPHRSLQCNTIIVTACQWFQCNLSVYYTFLYNIKTFPFALYKLHSMILIWSLIIPRDRKDAHSNSHIQICTCLQSYIQSINNSFVLSQKSLINNNI